MVKVQWKHHRGANVTWEAEEDMKHRYPLLFTQDFAIVTAIVPYGTIAWHNSGDCARDCDTGTIACHYSPRVPGCLKTPFQHISHHTSLPTSRCDFHIVKVRFLPFFHSISPHLMLDLELVINSNCVLLGYFPSVGQASYSSQDLILLKN
ncbi:hypothetical protein OSB04_001191 [Centaurea solstitialis]|uniref:Chromo domain-containing protein n=1 Tax=Centaurea solstitialis TaxID=347529 RepID=A0AA38U295_9ASTR|nr:hypothetical protein OSB04_001191 [Centaurea solstitialis]